MWANRDSTEHCGKDEVKAGRNIESGYDLTHSHACFSPNVKHQDSGGPWFPLAILRLYDYKCMRSLSIELSSFLER